MVNSNPQKSNQTPDLREAVGKKLRYWRILQAELTKDSERSGDE